MTRRDNAHVRPDHHIISNVDPPKVVHGTILVDKYIPPNANILAAGRIEWWNQRKIVIHLAANQIAEHCPNLRLIVERQTVEMCDNRHRPLDACHHRRRFRGSSENYFYTVLIPHILIFAGLQLSVPFDP